MKKRFLFCFIFVLLVAMSSAFIFGASADVVSTNVKGDINCDGKLTSSDFRLLERYLTHCDMSGVTFDKTKCDYNNDGAVDLFDLKGIASDADDMGTYSPNY